MDAFDPRAVEWGRSVVGGKELFLSAVDDVAVYMRCVLRFSGARMIVLEEEFVDVPPHGEAAFACRVVPCDVDACKF